jgi:hypothetical protein
MTPERQASESAKYVAFAYVVIPVTGGYHIYSGPPASRDFVAETTDLNTWFSADYLTARTRHAEAIKPREVVPFTLDLTEFKL